jgi:4-amino-4-deoxy-L-arabinose transferase-like glycosyltransferase
MRVSLDRGDRFARLEWRRVALGAVLLLSAGLNFYRLNREGFANLYYAAGVRGMLTSWHNAFFVSFDPGGFVSIDKPPLGFWLQALSAWIFGFHGWSILLPQALAAVVAVALLNALVARAFGPVAGIIAALALAVMPIDVVTARDNTIDGLLVPIVLLAAWAAFWAVETGRLRYLLLSAALFGVGFNVKELEALLALPACFLLYLIAGPCRWWVRIGHLALAGGVVAVLSLAWLLAVDLTPAANRPYVGSTTDNSELSLVIGHNGLDRLLPYRPTFRTAGRGVIGGGSAYETGAPGVLRLVDGKLAGQIDWLLPLGLLGVVVAAVSSGRPRRRLTSRQQALLLWTVWFGSEAAFFSVANYFHRYYLVVLTPALAAMVGIGVAALWESYRHGGKRAWVLPGAVMTTAAFQAHILDLTTRWRDWRVLPGAAGLAAVGLIVVRFRLFARPVFERAATTISLALLLVAPMAWATTTVEAGQADPASPIAGMHRPAGSDPDAALRQARPLAEYLKAHRGGARFLVATADATSAAPLILDTGEPVMAIGGFSGSDPILTAKQLAAMVKAGEVRYFLVHEQLAQRAWVSAQRSGPMSWVVGHCIPVTGAALPFATGGGGIAPLPIAIVRYGNASYALYDCGAANRQ